MWKYVVIIAVTILAFLITSYPTDSASMDDDTPQYLVESEFKIKTPPLPKSRPIKPLIFSSPMDYTQSQFICLAKNIYFEARGEEIAGQYAVGLVTLNRVRSKRFPNTICGVVYQARYWNNHPVRNRCHFSWYCDGKSDNPKELTAIDKAQWVAWLVLNGHVFDFTRGATHYHANYVNPKWNRHKEVKRIVQIDDHIFYRWN